MSTGKSLGPKTGTFEPPHDYVYNSPPKLNEIPGGTIITKPKYKVLIIEVEKGFGDRVIGHQTFSSLGEANQFASDMNDENDADQDYYVKAVVQES